LLGALVFELLSKATFILGWREYNFSWSNQLSSAAAGGCSIAIDFFGFPIQL
jgi:hypothetical protein